MMYLLAFLPYSVAGVVGLIGYFVLRRAVRRDLAGERNKRLPGSAPR